ncbi:MAG: hypothetical protein EHM36_01745, partial [Deltaproteobacteria bacterium]
MHTDEIKKFDKRSIQSNLRRGIVTQKEYEAYLARLPDVSGKVFHPDGENMDERPESHEQKTPKKAES